MSSADVRYQIILLTIVDPVQGQLAADTIERNPLGIDHINVYLPALKEMASRGKFIKNEVYGIEMIRHLNATYVSEDMVAIADLTAELLTGPPI